MKKFNLKWIDVIVSILINICLILVAVITPALIIASDTSYYQRRFEENGFYSRTSVDGVSEIRYPIFYVGGEDGGVALFSDDQLNQIIDHIVNYLFGEGDTFELIMDDVVMGREGVKDNVSVFGEKAISHMEDVKMLMKVAKILCFCAFLLLLVMIPYLIIRRKKCGKTTLKCTLWFYGVLFFIVIAFLIWSEITSNGDFLYSAWVNLHHLFFPFSKEKVRASFFDDALTILLSVDLFIEAVYIVLGVLSAVIIAYLVFVLYLYGCYQKNNL